MGTGIWSAKTYDSVTASKISSGSTFGYDSFAKSSGRYEAHKSLDPKIRNSDNVMIRESRDSDEHPHSTPIVVGFDATGSMGSIPRQVQKSLSNLFGLLTKKGYAEDPQISVTAYGDTYCDRVPLQLSQFESDNRIDDNLDNLFLEGGGGGNGGETQTLLWYYLANHTVTDAFEKRNKKGYLFIVADEIALPLRKDHVKRFLNPDEINENDLTVEGVVAHLKERWDTYILLVDNFSAKIQGSMDFYTRLFGKDHVLVMENPDTTAEVIGAAIGMLEGVADDETVSEDLTELGVDKDLVLHTQKTVSILRDRDGELTYAGDLGSSGRSAKKL